MAEDLYQLYLNMTPEGQRVGSYADSPSYLLEDSIRVNRPDVWQAYQSSLQPQAAPAPAPTPSGQGIYPFAPGSFQPAAPWISEGIYPFAPGSFEPVSTDGGMTTTPTGPSIYATPFSEAEDRARRERFQQSMTAAQQPRGADWMELIEALGAQTSTGGYTPVTVNRGLFELAQTPEEEALLARELADIEARRSAGVGALNAGWAQVARTNAAAAEKARQEVVQYGDAAAAAWTDAAARATELAAQRAQAAGAVAGRQSINVSPTGGAEDFIAFMQGQAPAARQFAERTQQTLASDLDWMANLGTAQGRAYQGELQRQANVMAFERAREHNRAVRERIAAERMALADMEFRAASTNAQLAQAAAQQSGRGASEIQGALTTALFAGDAQGPAVLASMLGLSPEQALAMYNSAKSSPLGVSLLRQATQG